MASLGNEKYGYLIGCHPGFALNSRRSQQFTSVSPKIDGGFGILLIYWKPLNRLLAEWTKKITINFLNTCMVNGPDWVEDIRFKMIICWQTIFYQINGYILKHFRKSK